MRTKELRIPEPGEVWFNPNYWGSCFITDNGMSSFNRGDENFPSLLCHLGGIGNSTIGSVPILYERDGWIVYDSYAEYIEHRRKEMISNLQETIRKVNEFCDREIAKGKPSYQI